jgi:hypothetical protein
MFTQMYKTVFLSLTFVSALTLGQTSFVNATDFRGETPAGAHYLLQTPSNWRPGDGVVIVNHGFQFEAETGDPSLGPDVLRTRMLAQGFAIVASSYSATGWANFRTTLDLQELLAVVKNKLQLNALDSANLGPLYLTGGSLGGLVSVQQAEQIAAGQIPELPTATGILSLCPPLAGSAVWDHAMDFRFAYDAICAGTNGGEMPEGTATVPWLLRPGLVDNGGSTRTYAAVVASAASCIGFEVPTFLQSNGMRTRRARLLSATKTPDAFLAQLLFYSTFAVSDLVYDAKKLGGIYQNGVIRPLQPFDTRGLDFGDTALNSSIRRLKSDPIARFELAKQYTPTGRIGSAKLLTVATSGDGLVVPEHLRFLEGKVPANQWRRALVQEATPSHCGFSDGELLASWEQLWGWSRPQLPTSVPIPPPSVSALNSACTAALAGSSSATSCRFASAENLNPLSSKITPRAALIDQPKLDAGVNGDWYTPGRAGEGLKIEALPDGRALVSFFSYPKAGDSGEQLWLTGTGAITDNGVAIDDLYQTRGARFGAAFNASDVRVERWGSLTVVLTECGRGKLAFTGPAGFGGEVRDIEQLSRQQVPCLSRQAQQNDTGLSGSWYDPARAGEGVTLTVQNDLSVALALFTYTPSAEQAWFVMQAALTGTTGSTRKAAGALLRPLGTRFGSGFQSSQIRVEHFGTVELEFLSCNQLRMRAITPWGTQIYHLSRLTQPLGSAFCSAF